MAEKLARVVRSHRSNLKFEKKKTMLLIPSVFLGNLGSLKDTRAIPSDFLL